MPVTKTAKRALRSSEKKSSVNKLMTTRLEIAIRLAKKGKKERDILSAISLADRSAKTNIIHKNKASRIKSVLSKLLPKSGSKKTKVKKPSVTVKPKKKTVKTKK